MLTEETVIDQIAITEVGQILVRRALYILRDGARATPAVYHRSSYEPGADLTHEDPRVQAIAAIVWTEPVLAAAAERREHAVPFPLPVQE